MAALDHCHNVFDLREAAKKKLPKGIFEFVDRGTEEEVALRNNRAAFERLKLKHRALVDVSGRSMETMLFGKPAGMLTGNEEEAKRYIDWGYKFVAVGADVGLLAKNADALAKKFKA